MQQPQVTCIIPTYNRVNLLEKAIESIICQDFSEWQLVIVDDGSNDGTQELLQKIGKEDERVSFYSNPGKGGSSARNFGLSKARGTYIAFLDDDDISLPHRFRTQLAAAKRSGCGYIVSGYEVRERGTNVLKSRVVLEPKGMGAGFPSRWLIKKELLEKVGGFDEDFPSMQDIELSYRLAKHEIFALHDDIVSVIYPTRNSVSTRIENSVRGKILLMERLSSLMPKDEAAWWYFNIGTSLFRMGDRQKAGDYFRKSVSSGGNIFFKAGLWVSGFIPKAKFSNRLLSFIFRLGSRKFTGQPNHPVIKL